MQIFLMFLLRETFARTILPESILFSRYFASLGDIRMKIVFLN